MKGIKGKGEKPRIRGNSQEKRLWTTFKTSMEREELALSPGK